MLALITALSYSSIVPWTDPFQLDVSHYKDCEIVDGKLSTCHQRRGAPGAIRVGCIGDSITAVGHTSSIAHHWPDQLGDILDTKHGNGTYSVTNLGVCGSTLQKEAHEPWSKTKQYDNFVNNRWGK